MHNVPLNIGFSLLSRRKTAYRILSLFEGRSVTEDDILREESGRPYLKGTGFMVQGSDNTDFNISHSGNMVAVSYVRGKGLKTGCDIQLVKERKNSKQIAEQFFAPAECKYILKQNEQGNDSAFFEIWTLKECYIKLHGLSVFDIRTAPDFTDNDGNLNLTQDGISYFLYKLNIKKQQYVLAAAVNEKTITPCIQRL